MTDADRHFNALLHTHPEFRHAYLVMLAERRAVIVSDGFHHAKTLDALEHARGRVAMLDELATNYEKESKDAQRRSDAAARSGRPNAAA